MYLSMTVSFISIYLPSSILKKNWDKVVFCIPFAFVFPSFLFSSFFFLWFYTSSPPTRDMWIRHHQKASFCLGSLNSFKLDLASFLLMHLVNRGGFTNTEFKGKIFLTVSNHGDFTALLPLSPSVVMSRNPWLLFIHWSKFHWITIYCSWIFKPFAATYWITRHPASKKGKKKRIRSGLTMRFKVGITLSL